MFHRRQYGSVTVLFRRLESADLIESSRVMLQAILVPWHRSCKAMKYARAKTQGLIFQPGGRSLIIRRSSLRFDELCKPDSLGIQPSALHPMSDRGILLPLKFWTSPMLQCLEIIARIIVAFTCIDLG